MGSTPGVIEMAKSTSRVVAAKPSRVKTAVCLSPESFKRLGAACIQEGMTQSELVELMISRMLSGYVISVRGQGIRSGPGVPIDRPSEGPDVNLAGSVAA
jgi:hypothetical protein